jgi:hypothetical protein
MALNCCAHHADELPHGCDQGRQCPERKARDVMDFPIQFAGPEPEENDLRARTLSRFHEITDAEEPGPTSTSWDVIVGLFRPPLLIASVVCACIALAYSIR